MSTTRTFYTFSLQLLNCRVRASANLAGVYFNGQNNSGVGATLTASSLGALTIDSVLLNLNDSVLLTDQTSTFQNGIYTVTNPGSASSAFVLTRRVDFQSIDQIKPGQYLSISAGTVNAGSMFVLIEPLPTIIGVSPIIFDSVIQSAGLGTAATKNASNNADPTLASVTGAYVIGNLPEFTDVNGSLGDSGIAPGTASSKAASDPAQPSVASVIGTTVAGDFLIAADAAGTVQDSGAALHAFLAVAIPGGSTTYSIPVPGMTAASIPVGTPRILANPAYIIECNAGIDTLTLTFNVDPGISNVNVHWTTVTV